MSNILRVKVKTVFNQICATMIKRGNKTTANDLINAHFQINASHLINALYAVKILLDAPL